MKMIALKELFRLNILDEFFAAGTRKGSCCHTLERRFAAVVSATSAAMDVAAIEATVGRLTNMVEKAKQDLAKERQKRDAVKSDVQRLQNKQESLQIPSAKLKVEVETLKLEKLQLAAKRKKLRRNVQSALEDLKTAIDARDERASQLSTVKLQTAASLQALEAHSQHCNKLRLNYQRLKKSATLRHQSN